MRDALTSPILGVYAAVRGAEVPVVAAVQGLANGFGCAMAAVCDVTIVADNSRFALPEMTHDLPPTLAMCAHIDRTMNKSIAWLVYSTGQIDAQTAHRYNLVNFLVEPADIEAETNKLATRLANGPTVSYGCIKELMYGSHANTYESQLALEARNFGICAGTEDWVEGVTAFAEKRTPEFKGK